MKNAIEDIALFALLAAESAVMIGAMI